MEYLAFYKLISAYLRAMLDPEVTALAAQATNVAQLKDEHAGGDVERAKSLDPGELVLHARLVRKTLAGLLRGHATSRPPWR